MSLHVSMQMAWGLSCARFFIWFRCGCGCIDRMRCNVFFYRRAFSWLACGLLGETVDSSDGTFPIACVTTRHRLSLIGRLYSV